VNKHLREQLKGQRIILAHNFQRVVHGQMALCFQVHNEEEHLGGWEHVEEETVHLMVNRMQSRRQGPGSGLTLKGMPPVTYFLLLDPTFQSFHNLPKHHHMCHVWGPHMSLWRTFHSQTITDSHYLTSKCFIIAIIKTAW
jgi:hypothetical protein